MTNPVTQRAREYAASVEDSWSAPHYEAGYRAALEKLSEEARVKLAAAAREAIRFRTAVVCGDETAQYVADEVFSTLLKLRGVLS